MQKRYARHNRMRSSDDTQRMHQDFTLNAILKECFEVHCEFLRRPKIIGRIMPSDPESVLESVLS